MHTHIYTLTHALQSKLVHPCTCYTHTHAHHTHTQVHAQTHTHAGAYTHSNTRIHKYTDTHTHTHTHNNIKPEFTQRTDVNMKMPLFILEKVGAVLKEAKSSSACGPAGCPLTFLKHFPDFFTPLCHLCNTSMRQQAVPQA